MSPRETFTVSLGIDYSIRVEYKPVLKFHQESGMLSKSSLETRLQKIKLKNTRTEPIKLTILDQFPLSSDEKIKVPSTSPSALEGQVTMGAGARCR